MLDPEELIINELESARLQSVSFFPYSLNEESDVVLLMRQKGDSQILKDFGTQFKENDPTVLHSAARAFLKKSAGLCLESEIHLMDSQPDILRIIKEKAAKNTIEVFENSKVQTILKVLLRKKSHVVLDVMCENHLVIFYPLPYFPLETINETLKLSSETIQTATKYSELQFHWVSLYQISDLQF